MGAATYPVLVLLAFSAVLVAAALGQIAFGSERSSRAIHAAGGLGLGLATAALAVLVTAALVRFGAVGIPERFGDARWFLVFAQVALASLATYWWSRRRFARAWVGAAVALLMPPAALFWWVLLVAPMLLLIGLAFAALVLRECDSPSEITA